jgi:CIC family chloride channel protein
MPAISDGRHQPRVRVHTPTGRVLLLSVLAALLGLAAGGAAWSLLHLIGLLTNFALFHRFGWDIPSFANFHPGIGLIVAAVAGATLVSLLSQWAPAIRGHGIPEAMEAILTKQSRISPKTAVAKPLSAAIAIGTGGPFGAEGPIIVTGGALGSLLGQLLPISPSERKILLATGAAAGKAATFGAPLAAVVLALELLLFEFSTRAFVPLVVGSSVAGAVHISLFGSGPLFAVPSHNFAGLEKLPLYVVLGILAGLLAVVIVKGLSLFEDGFERLPIPAFWHPAIGALGFAVIGLFVPRVLGVGYPSISDVLAGRLAIATLVILGLSKLFAWWIALASGTSGGTLAPILLISGCLGSALGQLFHRGIPSLSAGAFALVAMAATFGAATRATFAAIVFLFEITRDYQMILPLMLAGVIADLVASALLQESLLTEKLARRGLRVRGDYEVDILRTMTVRQVMTTEVETLPSDVTLHDARLQFDRGRHSAYPVVDPDRRVVAICTRSTVVRSADSPSTPLTYIADTDVVTALPTDTLLFSLHRMLDEGVEAPPVTDDDRLIGICTRTDILSARRHQLELEEREPSSLRLPQRWKSKGQLFGRQDG